MTIVQNGTSVRVEPACALLLRPLRPQDAMRDADERFAHTEVFSTLWSAAAMTARPVINRPNAWGWSARVSASAVVTQQRAGMRDAAPEAYWHAMPPGAAFRYHQSLETWAVVDDPSGTRFGRSRALARPRGWEQVIVVGTEGFRVTRADVGDRDIEADSVDVATRLGVRFATVSWAIPFGEAPAALARVNPFPSVQECRPVLTDVCAALLRSLTG